MSRIDTSKWGEFTVGDLFEIHPTRAYKMTNAELLNGGISPVVVNSAYNNGIGGYSSQKTTEKGNMITFSDTVDANTIYYQADDFVGYPHVQGLYPVGKYKDCWTRECLLFFVSSFRKSAFTMGFDYGNKFRRDIAVQLKVLLPIDLSEIPDWGYMRKYIRQLENTVNESLTKLQSVNDLRPKKIEVKGWKSFRLGGDDGLFEIVKGTRLTKADQREGDINFISASSFNNGIASHISNDEHIHPGNTLTVSYNGSDIGRTFYQEEPFWASDDVNVFYPRFNLNKNIALFLAPIIKAVGGNHVYKNKWLQEDMKLSEIMLPFKPDGSPDWDYMEQYMINMEKKIMRTIDNL